MSADFIINNIGATIKGYDNGDGTYTITTKGSKIDSKPTAKVLAEDEVKEKFGDKVNLKQDTFDRKLGGKLADTVNGVAGVTDVFVRPFIEYNPLMNNLKVLDAYANGGIDKAQEISGENIRKMFDPRNPYLWL